MGNNKKYHNNKLLIIIGIIGFFSFVIFSYGDGGGEEELEHVFQQEVQKEFKKTDDKILKYLNKLNKEKNYCFGPNKKMPFTECADEIEKKMGISGGYAKQYNEACIKALENVIKEQKNERLGNKPSLTTIDPFKGICHKLAEEKIEIYKNTSYDILKKNKYEVLKDEGKKMIQEDRTKYDKVLDLARIVLGNMGRMSNKWPSKTKKHIE